MRVRYDLLELYRVGGTTAHVAAVARAEGALDAAQMSEVASLIAVPRTVFELAARRDDCDVRARIFTPTRELPRSVEATLALAALRGGAVRVEEGVTLAEAWPVEGERWATATPPPVLGQKDVEDRALAAEAVGLDPGALDPELPVRAASCGPNVLIVPVRDGASLRRARLDPGAWRRTIEKARHHGAMLILAPGEGEPVEARSLAADDGEEWGNGLAASAAANYLRAYGRVGDEGLRFVFGAEGARRAELTVARDPDGPEARRFLVTARVRRIGNGEISR